MYPRLPQVLETLAGTVLYWTILHYTVLCILYYINILLYSTVVYNTLQYGTLLYGALPCITFLNSTNITIQYITMMEYIIVYI